MALGVHFVREFAAFSGWRGVCALVLTALGSITEGLGWVMVAALLQTLSDRQSGSNVGLTQGIVGGVERTAAGWSVEPAALIITLFAMAMLARAVLVAARQVVVSQLQIDYFKARQVKLIELLATSAWSKVAGIRHARIMQLLSSDISRVGMVAIGFINALIAATTLTVLFGIALLAEPRVALFAAAVGMLSWVVVRPMLRSARQAGEAATSSNLRVLDDVGQFLGAMKLAVSQNLQNAFLTDFRDGVNAAARHEMRFITDQSRVRLVNSALVILVICVSTIVGYSVLGVAMPALLAVMLIISRLAGSADALFTQTVMVTRSLPAYREMLLLAHDLSESGASTDSAQAPPSGDIRLMNCTYLHDTGDRSPAGVTNVSLTVPKGSFFGVQGPSGAGKTTLIDLIVGLYGPTSGSIEVGGAEIRLDTITAWRDKLSYVPQDPFLRNQSVLDNLVWGNGSASDREISEALAVSGAREVVANLPNGLDTIVGERGTLISGGERQRVAIARALLRKPQLLILDEATSAIDIAGEAELLRRLDELRPGMTIVIVSHRLESLERCDLVARMKGGRLLGVADNSRLSSAVRIAS